MKALLSRHYSAVLLLVVTVVYWQTLAPSVVQIDSGELAAVQYTLGIAHPTGYPLFTLVGHLFLLLPLGLSKIRQANVLAMLWCLGAVWLFLQSATLVLRYATETTREKRPAKTRKTKAAEQPLLLWPPHVIAAIAAATSALFVAFSRTWWQQSTSGEVYSLHLLLLNLVFYFLLRAWFDEADPVRSWLAVAFALALSFANHLTTLLILPGVAVLFFRKHGFGKPAWRLLALMLALFLPLLALLYLYLPLRATQEPLLNWGNPVDLERLLRHVSGKQYQVWFFSSSEVALRNLKAFIANFSSEFTWHGIVLALTGLYFSLRRNLTIGAFLLVTFAATVLYSINYDIHDLETYFLLAYVVTGIWIALGVIFILTVVEHSRFLLRMLVVLFAGLIVLEANENFGEVDQSELYIYDDYSRQALASLPNDAMLLSYQWDYLISPTYYLQFVEGFRRDVGIVDKELLRRSWYYPQLRGTCPEVIAPVESAIAPFLQALAPFETGRNFDASLLEQRYRKLNLKLISQNLKSRAVYVGPELAQGEFARGELYLPPGCKLVPDLFFFKVVSGEDYSPLEIPAITIRIPERRDRYSDSLRQIIANMWRMRLAYELHFQKSENASKLQRLLQIHFPELSP